MEINHFSHEHPLMLSEEKHNINFPCKICSETIFGLSYCCIICPFVLHKWCSDLPRKMSSEKLHLADHPLVLGESSSSYLCDICHDPINDQAFRYTCITSNQCSFSLHIECASFPDPLNIDLPLCDNKSRLVTNYYGYPNDRVCVICKISDNGPMLLMDEPNLDDVSVPESYRHIHCAMLPYTVKHSVHLHNLLLRPPLQENNWYFEFFCDACEKERDPCDHVYYCEPCEFVAHVGCGISGTERPIQDILGTCQVYKSIEESENEEQKVKVEEDEDEEKQEVEEYEEEIVGNTYKVEHYTHEHPLVMLKYREAKFVDDNFCAQCYMPIFGITYSCKDCKFHLHKWCAEVPREIQHNMHLNHGPLKLLPRDSFRCEFCESQIRTPSFSFGCEECDFRIEPHCAFLPNDLIHPSHEHALKVERYLPHNPFRDSLPDRSNTRKCHACKFVCHGVSLRCEMCDFYLHVECFLLPLTGKHEAHRHELSLTHSYQEDPIALEFICDFCEKARVPNRWVYCCPDPKCGIVAHVDCVVPNLLTNSEHEK